MLRIEAIAVGATTGGFLIASGTGLRGNGAKEVMNDLDITFDAIVQSANYINAQQRVWIPKSDNTYQQSGEIPLTVDYQFANSAAGVVEAFVFWKTLQATVPVLANVLISVGGATGVMESVKMRPLRVRTQGEVAVQVTYPISFGQILGALPAV